MSEPTVIQFDNGETITIHDMPPMPALRMQRVLKDALYIMAVELLKHIPGCWACPASRSCECTDKHDCPKHLCRYWLGRAEDLCSGEVPEW